MVKEAAGSVRVEMESLLSIAGDIENRRWPRHLGRHLAGPLHQRRGIGLVRCGAKELACSIQPDTGSCSTTMNEVNWRLGM